MANPSHIAMLAQIRSDLFDHAAHVGELVAGLRREHGGRCWQSSGASQTEDELYEDAAAIVPLVLSQRPVDTHDVASMMHCVADAADTIHGLTEPTGGKPVDGAEIARLAKLIERAADNIVALLALTAKPRNGLEQRRTAIVMQRPALAPASQSEGE